MLVHMRARSVTHKIRHKVTKKIPNMQIFETFFFKKMQFCDFGLCFEQILGFLVPDFRIFLEAIWFFR